MNVSDWIQLIVGIITGIGVLSSIIISVKTLKQSNEMIEENSRPIVLIYKDIFNFNSPKEYLVIKNFGNSIANITSITFDKDALIKISIIPDKHTCDKTFEFLSNSSLAPNQSYKIPINTKDSGVKMLIFNIEYHNIKYYKETIAINLSQDNEVTYTNYYQSGKELRDISNSIQEAIKRLT